MSLDQKLEFNTICRLCMSKDNVLISIFTSQLNSNLSFSDMIMSITTVNIITNDGLPDCICVKCIDKILKSYSFKIDCEKSDKMLRDYLQKKVANENSIKSNDPRKIIKVCKKRKYTPYILLEETNQVGCDKTNETVIQTDSEILKCFYCDYAVLTEETLKRHIASKHHKGKLKSDSKAKVEVLISTNKCCFCHYVFENKLNLKKHLEAKHLNKLNITDVNKISGTCHLCGLNSKNITLHLNEHYKHLYCNKCKMRFNDKEKFEAHMKEEMSISSNCTAVTEGQNIISSHTQNETTSEKYYCEYCGKVFSRIGLKNHARVQCGEKPYKCSICYKSYTSNTKLKTHMRMHDGIIDLYKCEDCEQSFKKSIELKHHNLIHAGQHPVLCDICNKGFHNITQLNEHVKKHTEESRHFCDQCGKSFASFESLKSHLYVHG